MSTKPQTAAETPVAWWQVLVLMICTASIFLVVVFPKSESQQANIQRINETTAYTKGINLGIEITLSKLAATEDQRAQARAKSLQLMEESKELTDHIQALDPYREPQ